VHAAVAFRGDRVALPRALFGAPAVAMTHVAAVAAVLTTYARLDADPIHFADPRSVATLVGLALAYLWICWLAGRPQHLWAPAVLATLAAMAAGEALGLCNAAVGLELLGLAWLWVLLAPRLPEPAIRHANGSGETVPALSILAGVLTFACALVPIEPDLLYALVLLGGSGVWIVLARRSANP